MTRLEKLDISSNAVVTVSGQSLAHLNSLKNLQFSGNYLRAITGDLLQHLNGIQTLNLEDNDISIIQPGLFHNDTSIKHLNLKGRGPDYNQQCLSTPPPIDGPLKEKYRLIAKMK